MWRLELRPPVCCECLLKAPLSISECWCLEELGTQGSWPVFVSLCAVTYPSEHTRISVSLCVSLYGFSCVQELGAMVREGQVYSYNPGRPSQAE